MFRIKGYFNQKSTDGKFSDQKWSLKKIQNKKGSKNDFFPHEKKFKFLTTVLKNFGLRPY